MVDTKITDLTTATAASGDEFVINDITDTSDKKVTAGSIVDIITGDITVNSSGVSALAANSVDSSELVDGGIDTSHIADKQITLAKMADGTDGELITWSATGVIAAVAVGTSTHVLTSNGVGVAPTFQAATGGLSNIVEDVSPQLGADLDANGFDINIDAGFLLTFDTGTQSQKIVGDAGGLTHTVPDSDTHDFIVDATTTLVIAETGLTVTGTTAISGILDVPDIETGLVSARDGTLAQTIADTTAVVTFAAKPVFDVGLTILGTIATGVWEGTAVTLANIAAIAYTEVVPCVLEIPEGTVAYPDIHTLATAGTKVTGMVLPDGAATSTINFKCVVPKNISGTPAMSIKIRIMTLAADSDHAIRLLLSTVGIATNEDADISLTAETEITAEMPNGTETMNEAEINIDLGTDWAVDDTIMGQLRRDPTDAVDDYAGDIMVVSMELLVSRTIS